MKCNNSSALEVSKLLMTERPRTEVNVVDLIEKSLLDAFHRRNGQHQSFMLEHTVDIQTCITTCQGKTSTTTTDAAAAAAAAAATTTTTIMKVYHHHHYHYLLGNHNSQQYTLLQSTNTTSATNTTTRYYTVST